MTSVCRVDQARQPGGSSTTGGGCVTEVTACRVRTGKTVASPEGPEESARGRTKRDPRKRCVPVLSSLEGVKERRGLVALFRLCPSGLRGHGASGCGGFARLGWISAAPVRARKTRRPAGRHGDAVFADGGRTWSRRIQAHGQAEGFVVVGCGVPAAYLRSGLRGGPPLRPTRSLIRDETRVPCGGRA